MRIMSIIGFAERFNTDWAVPKWHYSPYFKGIKEKDGLTGIKLQELNFHYDSYENYRRLFQTRVVDIKGYFQSYKYWTERLEFQDVFKSLVQSQYKEWLGDTVGVSVRRGDFVGNRNYFPLDESYYLSALKLFPGKNVIVFSDDINWCRKYFKNAFFCEASDIEQLCLMTLCDYHIISQSTFSFCGAFLSDSIEVIRPLRNFTGMYGRLNNEKDYWIPNWKIHAGSNSIS